MVGCSCAKRHLPYHESDHVLNLAYNALLDGQRLEDIELRRNDEAFLDGLVAQRIPDPTTSGDFTRRFNQDSVLTLMEAINATRQRAWEKQPGDFLCHAFIHNEKQSHRRDKRTHRPLFTGHLHMRGRCTGQSRGKRIQICLLFTGRHPNGSCKINQSFRRLWELRRSDGKEVKVAKARFRQLLREGRINGY